MPTNSDYDTFMFFTLRFIIESKVYEDTAIPYRTISYHFRRPNDSN